MPVVISLRTPGCHADWRAAARLVLKRVVEDPELLDGLMFGASYPAGPDFVATFIAKDEPALRRYLEGAVIPALHDLGRPYVFSEVVEIWDFYVP